MKHKDKNLLLISIIMNCHNGEKYLEKSLKSILNQDYKNWELIFFDNASNDESKNIFKSFDDKRLKYFYNKKKIKLYHARNKAIYKTKGDFISFLDTDDIWKKNFLNNHINIIQKYNSEIIYSKYFIRNEYNNKIFLKEKKQLISGQITQNLLNNYNIGIIAVMIKKNIFNKYNTNDLYKCFIQILINSKCLGGIIIIPLNFICSIRKADIELRENFIKKYNISIINIFEEQVFDDTSYSICSFQFSAKDDTIENISDCYIYPSNKQISFVLNTYNNYTIGGEIYNL